MGEKDGRYKKMMILKKWKQLLRHEADEFFINRQNMNDAGQKEGGSRQISITFPL